MTPEDHPLDVNICMGSSCFARGNAENLALLKNLEKSCDGKRCLRLTGSLCKEHCKSGPNVTINGETHHGINPQRLRALLQQMNHPAEKHGTA
jgi:NADH:ubiquinone oxidoreductase subunit E